MQLPSTPSVPSPQWWHWNRRPCTEDVQLSEGRELLQKDNIPELGHQSITIPLRGHPKQIETFTFTEHPMNSLKPRLVIAVVVGMALPECPCPKTCHVGGPRPVRRVCLCRRKMLLGNVVAKLGRVRRPFFKKNHRLLLSEIKWRSRNGCTVFQQLPTF